MKLINIFCILIMTVALYNKGFCQDTVVKKYPKVLVIENDTLVAFTIQQSKKLAMINESNKLCQKNLTDSDSIISIQLNQLSNRKKVIDNLYSIISNDSIIFNKKDELNKICNDELNLCKSDLKRHKIQKWIAYGVASVTSFFAIYIAVKD